MLRRQKLGLPVEHWFTQTRPRPGGELGPIFTTTSTLAAGKWREIAAEIAGRR
jgi:hypothetical protein